MADKKISELPAASALDTDDLLAVVEDGTTKKATIADLLDLAPSGGGIPTVINVVTEYAAAGDGTTNDRTAIQNAIDAASAAGGGVVYFPENTYLIGVAGTTVGLTIPSEVTLRGAGPGASIIKSASTTNGVSVLKFATSATHARIESLTIDASSTTTSSHGVYHQGATDCHTVDVQIAAKFGWGIFMGTDTKYCMAARCTIAGTTGSHGIEINGSSYNTVIGCHITNGGVAGANNIEIYDASATRCVANKLVDNTLIGSGVAVDGGGILTAGDIGTVIKGNTIINAASYGIYLSNSAFSGSVARECVIEGNIVKGADAGNRGTTGAIYLDFYAQRCTIVGNTVEGSGNGCPGIRSDGVNNTIANNVSYLNGGHGIHIASTAHRNTASGNVCIDNSGTAVDSKFGLNCEADSCSVVGNVGSDTRGASNRQYHGVVISGGTTCLAVGNKGTGNRNVAVYDSGTRTVRLGNEGTQATDIKILTNPTAGTTETLVGDAYHIHDVTLDENITFTFTTTAAVTRFTLILRQDINGTNTVTWPASVKWHAATPPTILTSASAVHVLEFLTVDTGTTWRGSLTSSNVS